MITANPQTIDDLPRVPAVYVMYGFSGWRRGYYVAYVGMAKSLKPRIRQHLVLRDSSVATGAAAAVLNPDAVRDVWWWEHPTFDDRRRLEAAELVAFDFFEPALRSRGGISNEARAISTDGAFRKKMLQLFEAPPSGVLSRPTLEDLHRKVEALEEDVEQMRAALEDLQHAERKA